ncbi:MAG TPA: hypothetical protein VJR89_25785, partial [Polyangiales bacterium]|nr:hypothetical protein [Polyangiales bacterium]
MTVRTWIGAWLLALLVGAGVRAQEGDSLPEVLELPVARVEGESGILPVSVDVPVTIDALGRGVIEE